MKKIQWIILLVFLLNNLTINGQTAAVAAPSINLNRIAFFAEDKAVQISLSTDFKKLLAERKKRGIPTRGCYFTLI